MEPFTYTSLAGATSFRLLTLQPGQTSDNLQCHLSTHDAATAPPYLALSYVWGSTSRNLPLEITSGSSVTQLLTTPALDAALRRLRLPHSPLTLWADQLCINQLDLDERTHQVRLMQSIYSRARRVIVFLGPDPDNHAPGAVSLIRRIHAVWDDHIGSLRFPSNEQLSHRGLPPQTDPSWRHLEAMLNLPYFTRIWVVQECRLAMDLLLVWGTQEIPWMHFYHTYYWIATNSAADGGGPEGGVSLNINSEILFSAANCDDKDFADDFGWLDILKATRMLEASDPRDKVYALLGLFGDKAALVTPDYRASPARVFADFTARMVPQMDSLRLLSFARLSGTPEAPLWAPRWDWDRHGDVTYKPFEHYQFSASRDLRPVVGDSSRWDVLTLKGFLIDAIECATAPLTAGIVDTPGNLVDEAWELVVSKKELLEGKYTDKYALVVALVWTLTAGQCLYPHIIMYKPAEHDHLLDFAAYQVECVLRMMSDDALTDKGDCMRGGLELALLAREAYAHLHGSEGEAKAVSEADRSWIEETMAWAHTDDGTVDSACELFEKLGADADAHLRYQAMMCLVTAWRRVFVMDNGYVGLGAHGVQPGDKVCVLFGGATPYVVRPTGVEGEYLFMGECYVHGLMDGEAITLWEAGELREEWFSLR